MKPLFAVALVIAVIFGAIQVIPFLLGLAFFAVKMVAGGAVLLGLGYGTVKAGNYYLDNKEGINALAREKMKELK